MPLGVDAGGAGAKGGLLGVFPGKWGLLGVLPGGGPPTIGCAAAEPAGDAP